MPACFLSSYVLGVRLDGPAAKKHLLIEPRPGDLTRAEGVVVKELGLVPIEWKREADTSNITFTVPPGATATVRAPSPGAGDLLQLDGETAAAKSAGRYLELHVPAGKHTIIVTSTR